jgi:hypothetical protein
MFRVTHLLWPDHVPSMHSDVARRHHKAPSLWLHLPRAHARKGQRGALKAGGVVSLMRSTCLPAVSGASSAGRSDTFADRPAVNR